MAPRIAIPSPTSFDPAYNRLNFSSYGDSVLAAGGEPVEVDLGLSYSQLLQVADSCDGILLPGSPADVNPVKYGQNVEEDTAPADAKREFTDETLLASALRLYKPVLGVCFGTQMINVFLGGTLIQNLTIMPVNHSAGRSIAVAHAVSVTCNSRLAGMLDGKEAPETDSFMRLPVNSSHHQAVGIPGLGLQVSARCPQDAVVEAIESAAANVFLVGVQWHPERTYTNSASSRLLFSRLIAEATTERFAPSEIPALTT